MVKALLVVVSLCSFSTLTNICRAQDPLSPPSKAAPDSGPQRPAQAEEEPTDPYQQASQEIARRLQELQQQLAEATAAGKQELAQRLKQELSDYLSSQAHHRIEQARERAEELAKQRYEQAEKQLQQWRDQGGAAVTQRWLTRAKSLLHRQQMEARIRDLHGQATGLNREINQLLEDGQHELARRRTQQLAVTLDMVMRTKQLTSDETSSLSYEQREALHMRQHLLRTAATNLVALEMYALADELKREEARVQRALRGESITENATLPGEREPLQKELKAINRRLDALNEQLKRLSTAKQTGGDRRAESRPRK